VQYRPECACTEEKSDDSKDSFYKQLEQVVDRYPNDHTKILLDFKAKLARQDIFLLTNENEGLHQDSDDNGIRTVIFATSKNLVVNSMMFLHKNIHKCTWTSPDGQTHS